MRNDKVTATMHGRLSLESAECVPANRTECDPQSSETRRDGAPARDESGCATRSRAAGSLSTDSLAEWLPVSLGRNGNIPPRETRLETCLSFLAQRRIHLDIRSPRVLRPSCWILCRAQNDRSGGGFKIVSVEFTLARINPSRARRLGLRPSQDSGRVRGDK